MKSIYLDQSGSCIVTVRISRVGTFVYRSLAGHQEDPLIVDCGSIFHTLLASSMTRGRVEARPCRPCNITRLKSRPQC